MIDLTIVVVTYKEGLDVLKACFDSVYASQNIRFELVIVDNGASAATKGLLSSYDGATYLRNEENKGFAAAVNRGMHVGKGRYFLLLNPDTAFGSKVLLKMVTHLDEDAAVGVASSVIRYPDGSLQESIRRFPGFLDQLLMLLKVPRFVKTKAFDWYMMRDVDPLKTQDVDSIMGAFMFIRRELTEAIGYFDERYFIWFEEVDFCKMTDNAGWKIRHYADVEIMHLKGHAFNKIATLRKQRWIRESLRKYVGKHMGMGSWLFFWIFTPVFVALGHVTAIIKRG
jgi:GT2 family glycosyltransferase